MLESELDLIVALAPEDRHEAIERYAADLVAEGIADDDAGSVQGLINEISVLVEQRMCRRFG